MDQVMSVFLSRMIAIGFLAVVAAVLGGFFHYFVLPRLKGAVGEFSVNLRVKRALNPNEYRLIQDVMLSASEGTTQIDHIIVSRYGIFVVETKAYTGWIFGTEGDAQWTQVIYRRNKRFQNPLRQNYGHIRALAELTEIPEEYFKSLVVFTGNCTFKTSMPANVVRGSGFIKYIRSFQNPIIPDQQVPEIESAIRAWTSAVSDEQRAQHITNIRRKKHAAASESDAPACPR